MNMSSSKNKFPPNANVDAILTCECGMVVKVGTGGQGNLIEHRKSTKHQNAMQKIMSDERAKKFKAFFSCPKLPAQPDVPIPSTLESNIIDVPALPSVTNPLLTQLKHAIARLPSTIPKGTPNDVISKFSSLPILDSTLDDQWEILDPILNRFLGFGKSVEDIKCDIRTGPYGADGLYEWLCFCITKGGVPEELLEGKLTRLIDAMNELIKESEPNPESASKSLATSELTSPEVTNADASPVHISSSQQTLPKSTPDIIDADDLSDVIDIDAIPMATTKKNTRILCHGIKVHCEPGHSVFSEYPFNLHAHLSLPWTIQFKGKELMLYAKNCKKICYADPCVNCLLLKGNTMLSGILHRMSTGATEHTPWMWLSHAQLEEKAHRLRRQVESLKLHGLNTGSKVARRTGNTDLILPESSEATSSKVVSNLVSSKIKAIENESPKLSAEEIAGSGEEHVPTGGSTDNLQAYMPDIFTQAMISHRGGWATIFKEEICDCGMGDKSVDISGDADDWTCNPDLVECQAIGCEIKAFHLNCQGLRSVPLNWMCQTCKSMNRKTAKRARK